MKKRRRMDHPMSKEESYADRRQLFKDIWKTAMNIDGKETNVINKPKVIKTLRLDEVDRCIIGKKKKERIKNLRVVCNKLLDFCDRQEADDIYYKQLATSGRESPFQLKDDYTTPSSNKFKRKTIKRKAKKARSMINPPTTATSPDIITIGNSKSCRPSSPAKFKNDTYVYNSPLLAYKSLHAHRKNIKKSSPVKNIRDYSPKKENLNRILVPGTNSLRSYNNKQVFPINKIIIK